MGPKKFGPNRGISVASSSERRLALVALVALVITALAAPAQASVLRGMTLRDLRAGADAIVTGRVVAVRTVVADGIIETIARVRVAEVHKGEAARVVAVRVPGGIARGKRLIVPGTPTFERGVQVLLFLYRAEDDWRPVGLFQGVWTLDEQEPGSAMASSSGGAALMREPGQTLATDRTRRDVTQLVGGAR
jgi:hypothetical protein